MADRERTPTSYLDGWSRERLLQTWIDEVTALGITPAALVQSVAAAAHGCEWWPRADLDELERSSAEGVPQGAADSDGPRQTLEYLLQTRGDAHATAAVLLCASLFARVERARSRYPREAWPPFAAAQTLLAWTRAQHDYRWPTDCPASLPEHISEEGLVLGGVPQLLRFLAVEHARVLHRYAPVQLIARPRDNLVSIVRVTHVEPERDLLALSLPAPAQSLRAPRDPARRRDPRWSELTREELATLIWSKPQREVARDFGVSEATVAKRCKLLEIAKPERGFWRRSRAPAAAGS